jgi:hypothetical protein
VLLGSILLGLWLVLAVSPPAALRSLGFGPLLLTEERDPYARPPAGSGTPLESLQRPAQPIDLKDLVPTATPEPAPAQPPPPPPAAGGRATLTTTLTLSAATSAAGEGIVLIGKVRGDGRPIHGTLDFLVGDRVVSRQVLRVQGDTSQAEYRLVGLRPGLYALRVAYRGSHTYAPSESDQVPHRVAPR